MQVTTHVAIYARISEDDERRGEGVADQEQWGRQYAADRWPDLPIVVYADNDIGAGRRDVERPGFRRLVDAIRSGTVAHLVARDRNRLTRDASEWFDLADNAFLPAGIHHVHTKFRGVMRVDDIAADFDAILGRRELRIMRTLVLDKHRSLAEQGRPIGGGEQFGYRRSRDSNGRSIFLVEPSEAAEIRHAYTAIFGGRSLAAVATDWTDRNVPRPRGGSATWTATAVRSVMIKPAVAGLRAHRPAGKVESLYPATWDPIVTRDAWERMKATLASRHEITNIHGQTQRVSHSKQSRRRYLLTGGMAVCGTCGERLSAAIIRSRNTRDSYYRCSGPKTRAERHASIHAEKFEQQVQAEFLAMLDTPQFKALVAAGDPDADRRAEVVDALAALDTRRSEFGRMIADGDMDHTTYQAARGRVDEQERALRAELGQLAAIPPPVDLDDMAEDWVDADLNEKRHLLSLFVDRVEVSPSDKRGVYDPDRVTIRWRR